MIRYSKKWVFVKKGLEMVEIICVFIILLAFEFSYLMVARRLMIMDKPHHQSSHTGSVIRGGGIVFYIAFLLWYLINGFSFHGGLTGLSILALVSFVDDIHSISPKIRLACQFLAILLLFYHSGLIRTPLYVILFLATSCVGALNIYNFMDGINGMTGGFSLVVSAILLYVNTYQVHFIDNTLLVYVLISIIVFNLFNFRKKALCFAGDVGALSIGYILVYLVLRLCLRGQSMSWIVMLAVYFVDGGMTILHRILLRENLMKPHKKHAYQIMANELKLPHLVVSGIYMGLQAVCCVVYITWPGYTSFFAIFGTLIGMYLVFMKKYYHLHVKNH